MSALNYVIQERRDQQPIHDAIYQQFLLTPATWEDTSSDATNYADVYAAAGDCLRQMAAATTIMSIYILSGDTTMEQGGIFLPALSPGPDPIHGWTQ